MKLVPLLVVATLLDLTYGGPRTAVPSESRREPEASPAGDLGPSAARSQPRRQLAIAGEELCPGGRAPRTPHLRLDRIPAGDPVLVAPSEGSPGEGHGLAPPGIEPQPGARTVTRCLGLLGATTTQR